MKKVTKKAFCVLLSVLMMLSVMPLSSFAEELKEIKKQNELTENLPSYSGNEYEGQLLSAEIVKGNVKQVYEADENGELKLISEETVGRRGLLRAPKKESSGMDNADIDNIFSAAQWALSHSMDEAYLLVDKNNVGTVIYGTLGYDAAVKDADYDGICDDCGYCLDGCTDGTILSYSEADIASGPDADGKYYNADGLFIGTDAVGTYTYQLEDENGQPIYDENGKIKTSVMEYSFISFETYKTGMDGVCDVCGKSICRSDEIFIGHDFSDGFCDGCGSCMGDHVDNTTPPAEETPAPANEEENTSNGEEDPPSNNEGETPSTDKPDGICDLCGYCMSDCADADADGACDVCGKQLLSGCDHKDIIGKDTCNVCGAAPCHSTLLRLQQIQAQLSMMQSLLLEADKDGTASFHEWLDTTFTPFMTAKENGGDASSFASAVSKRIEAQTIRRSGNNFTVFKAYLDDLSAENISPESLAGRLVEDGDTVTLSSEGSLYAQLETLEAQYLSAANSVIYEENKGYYTYVSAGFFEECRAKLDKLTGDIFDLQLAAVFGSKVPKKINVTEQNARSLKNAVNAVSEVLLYRLYGTRYQDNSYTSKAASVWAGGSAASYDDETRRSVGFAMLPLVTYSVNELREAAFTSFKQTTYDTDGVYAVRPAYDADILRDPNNAADTYTVTEETINTLISRVDKYLGSEEAAVMLQRFIPESFGIEVKDANADGIITIYDIAMSYLSQKVFSDDVINELFSLIFPTVTKIISDIPSMLTDNDYIKYHGNGRYTIDLIRAITLAAGGSSSVADAISTAADVVGFSGSFEFYVDGGKARSVKNLLSGAGFSFWPYQIASLLDSLGDSKYDSIISALRSSGDNWSSLLDENGKLNFNWDLESFDDFKDILSVLLSSVSPVLEALFSKGGKVSMNLSNAVYISMAINLGFIAIPAASDGGAVLNFNSFSYYQDIVAPVFEALGVNSFAPADGSYVPTYTFRDIYFDSLSPTTHNVGKVVDGILDPLQVLVEQLVSHPLEKMMSILPNAAIMLENGALTELFDLDSSFSAIIKANFNMSVSSFFDGLEDIIENQIMDDWYDWLNPVKYAQLISTVIAYSAMEPVLALVFDAIGDIDAADMVRDGLIDISGEIDDIVTDDVFPMLPEILERVAAAFGGKLKDGATNFNWPKDVEINGSDLVSNLNIYTLLEAYLLSPAAVKALGFDLSRASTLITWLFNNLVDEDGNAMRLFDPAKLDLDELSSLGTLEKRGGSIRDAKYAKRWNNLGIGEYYFVNADIADVFYYGLKFVSGILNDKTSVKTLLSLIGLDYDELKSTIADLAAEGAGTVNLTLSELVAEACDENGKFDLDKLLSGITADDLLFVLCETVVPTNDYVTEDISYPETTAATAQEIDSNNGVIPYLEYDNQWTRQMASLMANDIDDFVDTLLKELPYDLDPSTTKVETLREYAKPLLLKYLNEPAYLTLITQLLAGAYDDSLSLYADIIKDATGIDITVWANDFAYLFDENAAEPESKHFPLLTGLRTGETEDGKPLVKWTYDGKTVETYSDILAALGYLLTPAQPVLDMVFCGEDFKVLPYSENGQPAGSVVTVKGNDGYNFAILPMLEAMGINGRKMLSSEEFREKGAAEGLLYCLDLVVDHLFEIFDSDTMLADLMEMLAQVSYALSDNGLNTITKNLMHPLLVLVDTLRPVLNIDFDSAINSLICQMTYQIGGYTSPKEMLDVMKLRNAAISLRTIDIDNILKALGVICSVEKNGTRYFLEADQAFDYAVNDLAYLREPCISRAYKLDENGQRVERQAYRLNVEGPDALTVMTSMGLEILMYGSNATVLDSIIGEMLGMKGIVGTAIELMHGIPVEYTTAFNWAYILGADATAQEKAMLLASIKNNGPIAADNYRTVEAQWDFDRYLETYDQTNWDEGTAEYLVQRMDDMISNALNIKIENESIGATLLESLGIKSDTDSFTTGSFIMTLVNGMVTDDNIDLILGFIGDFLNGRDNELLKTVAKKINKRNPNDALALLRGISEKLAKYHDTIFDTAAMIGVDLAAYDIDISQTVYKNKKVTYCNAEGEPTGLIRPVVKDDLANLADILYSLIAPVKAIVPFLMLGDDLQFFNSTGITEGRNRRDDLVSVTGMETYRYVLLPLLEAMGCTGLKSADSYINNGEYDTDGFLHDLLDSVVNRVRSLLSDDGGKTLNALVEMLPDLLYYVNSNAVGISLQNLTAQVRAILDLYNSYAGNSGDDVITLEDLLKQLIGLDVDLSNISLTDLAALLVAKEEIPEEDCSISHPLFISTFVKRLLNNFTVGKIYYNADSVCDFDTYRMTYRNNKDKAAAVTILMSAVFDVLEDPDNEGFFTTVLGKDMYDAAINLFNLNDFKFDYQEPSWLFTDDANQLKLLTAMTFSKLFNDDPYVGRLWTRDMAAILADNLEGFIADMLYLLGIEINGVEIRDFRALMHAIIGGTVFSDDTLNTIASMLGKIKGYLDEYDPDGAIAGFIKELLDVDLHAWDDYAPSGKYENGRDWGFLKGRIDEAAVDTNGEIFEARLIELLTPAASVFAWLLADSDYTVLVEGDGLGKNAEPIQITVPGSEGYRYGLIPMFEALNIDGSPQNLVENLRDGDICDPETYTQKVKEDVNFAVVGVIHPMVRMIQKMMDSTATSALELMPSIVYFINCNGIDTMVKNITHSVQILGNAIEPIKDQIGLLVYDEQGIDLYRTLNVEKIVRENIYEALGVTENDVKTIYRQCGGTWTAVDGLEDIDFRLLFSIALASVNNWLAKNGVPFKFTSIAGLAVNELTHGYVRSYDSLTGNIAYTMVLDKEIDRYCYGDMLSILFRLILKFMAVDGNIDALMGLIRTKAEMSDGVCAAATVFLMALVGCMQTDIAYGTVMYVIFNVVYGATNASYAGVGIYDGINSRIKAIIDILKNVDDPTARSIMQNLIAFMDEYLGDVISSDGIASHGLIRFFKQIYQWFKMIFQFIQKLFKKQF